MYRRGIEWIAFNDDPGDPEALNPEAVSGLISVVMLADITNHDAMTVAKAVVNHRKLYAKRDARL